MIKVLYLILCPIVSVILFVVGLFLTTLIILILIQPEKEYEKEKKYKSTFMIEEK